MSRPVPGDLSSTTIVAPATAPGRADLALLRLSGPEAGAISDRLFRQEGDGPCDSSGPAPVRTGVLLLSAADDSLPAPLPAIRVDYPEGRSYTGERSVEWLIPSIPMLVRAAIRALEREGAVPAGPGEFTRRAFERGRLDLTQAESVAALIHAEDELACRAARSTLDGSLARGISSIGDRLHDQIALLEAGLDFGDQDVETPSFDALVAELSTLEEELLIACRRPDPGSAVVEARRVLIWGRANAGKSTLLNALVGSQAALVSDREGTTTDAVGARLSLPDGSIELVDLPGRKGDRSAIEEAAEARAQAELESGDPVLYLFDATEPRESREEEWGSLPLELRERVIPVLSQIDRLPSDTSVEPSVGGVVALRCSSITSEGLAEVREWLRDPHREGSGAARGAQLRSLGAAFNDRQREGMESCRATLTAVRGTIKQGLLVEPELIVIDLRRAHESLQEVTGELATEETLTRIFSRFCVGK